MESSAFPDKIKIKLMNDLSAKITQMLLTNVIQYFGWQEVNKFNTGKGFRELEKCSTQSKD